MDVLLREAENIFTQNSELIGPKIASRIWGFISKFVMLDRFAITLFGTDFYPASPIPRRLCNEDYIGTGAKVNVDVLSLHSKFLKQYSDT